MTKNYKFEIKGTAGDGQTWTTRGQLPDCGLDIAFDMAMRESFDQLTKGKAIFGKPGVGCRGPYDVRSVLIEQEVA